VKASKNRTKDLSERVNNEGRRKGTLKECHGLCGSEKAMKTVTDSTVAISSLFALIW
jgi:hypothetical protein